MKTTQSKAFDATHLTQIKQAVLTTVDCVRQKRVEDYADLALCVRAVLDLAIQHDEDHSQSLMYFVFSVEDGGAPSSNDAEDWELIAYLKTHTPTRRERHSEHNRREKVFGPRDRETIVQALLVAADALTSGLVTESYQVGMCLHPTVSAAVFNESDIEEAIVEFGNVLHFGSATGWKNQARRHRLVAFVTAELHRRLSNLV